MIINRQKNGPLKGVVAYVDVQSSFGNPAIAVKNGLELLGAVVSHNLNSSVTHIVFRNGTQASKLWAARRKIHLVSPVWVNTSRILNRKAPESKYSAEQEKSVVTLDEIRQENVSETDIPISKVCPSTDDAVLSVLPVFTHIRVNQKFVRPSTPPEMKNFMLRLRSNQGFNGVNSLCSDIDDSIEKSVANFPFTEGPEPTQKEEFSRSICTQEFLGNPKPPQGFSCLSPIKCPEVAFTCSDPDLTNKLLPDKENFKSFFTNNHTEPKIKLYGLVEVKARSPLNELIIPISRQNSPSKTPVQRIVGHRKDQIAKKLSPSTPVTPDVLMNFVSSIRTIKSVKTNKGGFVPQANFTKRKTCKIRIKPRKLSRTKTTKLDHRTQSCTNSSTKCIDSVNHTDQLTERFTNRKSISRTRDSCLRKQILKSRDVLLHMNNSNTKLKPICTPKLNLFIEICEKDEVLTKKVNQSTGQLNQDENFLGVSSSKGSHSASTYMEKSADWDCTPNLAFLNRYQCARVCSISKTLQSTSKVLKTKKQNPLNEIAQQNFDSAHSKRKSISQMNILSRRNSFDEFRSLSSKSNRTKRNSVDTSVQTDDFKFKSIRILFSGTLQEEEMTLITLLQTSSLKNYGIHHTSHSKNVNNNHMLNDSNHSKYADKKFTHLVTVTPLRRTLKLFYAIMRKVHIVTVDWIRQSASSQIWLSEIDYRPTGLPRMSRIRTIDNLFATVGSVYIASGTKPSRRDLVSLLTLGGASITNKQTEANVLIGHILPNKICVQFTWILDSILSAKLLQFNNYKLNN